MIPAPATRAPLAGIACAVGATLMFSINDVTFKVLSGDYPLHELVLVRSCVGLAIMLVVIVPMNGGYAILRTAKWRLHLIRAGFVVVSNLCFFLAIASMPLADAVAVFFVAPLLVTALSVPMLGERVGLRRWAAVLVGLVGVIVMIRPGAGSFQPVALLSVLSALSYALMHMMTRRMGGTESALTMTVFVQVTFIVVCIGMGLVVGNGRFAGSADPALAFLFRAWVWPAPGDLALLCLVGLTGTIGGILIAQAYKLGEAGLVAPFEYVAMPMAIVWGVTVFGTWPDPVAWAGIALICGAGLYVVVREAVLSRMDRRIRRNAPASGDL